MNFISGSIWILFSSLLILKVRNNRLILKLNCLRITSNVVLCTVIVASIGPLLYMSSNPNLIRSAQTELLDRIHHLPRRRRRHAVSVFVSKIDR